MAVHRNDTSKRNKWLKAIIRFLICFACACFLMFGFQGYRLSSRKPATNGSIHKAVHTVEGEVTIIADAYNQTGTTLRKTTDAGQEYVDETLFLGDSNTVRFMKFYQDDIRTYTSIYNTIAVVGMGVDAITTLPCMQFSFGTYTMPDAVALLQPRRILMTFGTNNLDGLSTNTDYFIQSYTYQIQCVHAAYPYADIIVSSIYPFTYQTIYSNLSILQLTAYNQAIARMCEENGWKFLNVFETLIDPVSGYGEPSYFEDDGIHLNVNGIEAVFEYFRTHAYITEDTRPELYEVGEVYGPLTNLYEVDPLNNSSFSQEVLDPNNTENANENSQEIPLEEELSTNEEYEQPQEVPDESEEIVPQEEETQQDE